MKVTRIYASDNGESHFEDLDIPLKSTGDIGALSEELSATGFFLRETLPDFEYSWHTVPERLCLISLSGASEIEVSDGDVRQFYPGDIIIAEDVSGKGHISRAINNAPRKTVVITLD